MTWWIYPNGKIVLEWTILGLVYIYDNYNGFIQWIKVDFYIEQKSTDSILFWFIMEWHCEKCLLYMLHLVSIYYYEYTIYMNLQSKYINELKEVKIQDNNYDLKR